MPRQTLLFVLPLVGCLQVPENPYPADWPDSMIQHEKLIDELYDSAEIVLEFDGGKLFVKYSEPRREWTRGLNREGLPGDGIALIEMEKRIGNWSREELDRVESVVREAGYENIVIVQATGVPGTPVLRGLGRFD